MYSIYIFFSIHLIMIKDFEYRYNTVDFKKRVEETKKIREKYPDRVPVIVSRAQNCTLNDIDKHKFLVPNDLTIGQFVNVIRKRIKVSESMGIFIFVKNILPPNSSLMSQIYNEFKEDDGFLYIIYNGESVFGL